MAWLLSPALPNDSSKIHSCFSWESGWNWWPCLGIRKRCGAPIYHDTWCHGGSWGSLGTKRSWESLHINCYVLAISRYRNKLVGWTSKLFSTEHCSCLLWHPNNSKHTWQDKSAPTRTIVSYQSIKNFERSGWTARIQSCSYRRDK